MPIFFVSYSRLNVRDARDRELIARLVADLDNDVRLKIPDAGADISFFDTTDIELGTDWNDELSTAVSTSRLAVCLFSPSYFSSVWCGREFQVFLDRRAASAASGDTARPTSIIPVWWMKAPAPEVAGSFQFTHDALPADYLQVGLRQMMRLSRTYGDAYEIIRDTLSDRIVGAYQEAALPEISRIDLRQYASAWSPPAGALPSRSHRAGSVSKTCFVYLSRNGWDWAPYADPPQKVGAFAQQLTGELGLQYQELSCDRELPARLVETNQSAVPTLIIGDPSSVTDPEIEHVLRTYDQQYLLNCGVLVPWEAGAASNITDQRWTHLAREVCPQKTLSPPPDHEWRSIFSPSEFRTRALSVVENIRLRLLQRILSDAPPVAGLRSSSDPNNQTAEGALGGLSVSRVENKAAEDIANTRGIGLSVAPVVNNVPPAG